MTIPTFGDPHSDNPDAALCVSCRDDQPGGALTAAAPCEGCGAEVCELHGDDTPQGWMCWTCIEAQSVPDDAPVCAFCGTVHPPLRVGTWKE